MLKYFLIMLKHKCLFFSLSIILSIFIFNFVFVDNVLASSSNIVKLVFTTDTQNISTDTISEIITVQTQNFDGTAENLDETSDLYLSSSIGGEFSSNNTNWKPIDKLTMSNGSANRNFYFKSFQSGKNTITAKLVGRVSNKEWPATQDINVGILSATTSDSENNNSNSNTSTSSTSTTNASVIIKTVYISTHSGEEDLSNYNDKTAFEITAGRERMALVGSPLEFDAKYSLSQKDQCVPVFKWSFGDGFEAVGKKVVHTYKHPGEYQVVLNGNCGDYNSISRTTVKVNSPNILILNLENGDMEMLNNSNTEINIGNWKIKGG